MDAEQVILTRQLPKTGQVISYYAGDDGITEAGWWMGRLNINNKTRFISKTIDDDDVVIDRATGLIWAADGWAEGCNRGGTDTWPDAIDYANGLIFAGFTDWRMPNILELISIIDFALRNPAINETFFPATIVGHYWSSTTYANSVLEAQRVSFSGGSVYFMAKTESAYLRCVRGGV